jgi:hypothetical protein
MRVFFHKQNVFVNNAREDRVKKFRLFLVFGFLYDYLTNHLFFCLDIGKIVDEIKEALDVTVVVFGPLIESAVLAWTSAIVLDLHDFGTDESLDIGQVINSEDFAFLYVPGGKDSKSAFQVDVGAVAFAIERKVEGVPPKSVADIVIEFF